MEEWPYGGYLVYVRSVLFVPIPGIVGCKARPPCHMENAGIHKLNSSFELRCIDSIGATHS